MEIVAGLIAAVFIVGFGDATGQGRSLAFSSSVFIVIALLYVLFAVMAGGTHTIVVQSTVAAAFVVVAVAAARWRTRRMAGLLITAGLAAHGGYDLMHVAGVSNPGVPAWWPVFYGVVDVVLGGWVGLLVSREDLRSRPAE